jgi:type VI secretion system protein ImpJ
MSAHDVHWHEGMFLRPQHFQAGRSHLLHVMAQGQSWDTHYNWGLRAIEIDADALANFRFVVRRLRARARDGTLVDAADGPLPELDLKPAMEGSGVLTILLAVPQIREGHANAGTTADEGKRFLVEDVDLEDENTGASPQLVQVRRLNVKLLLSTQDQTGYTTLPLAKIERSDRAEGLPQVHFPYIPPLLACDAWEPLAAGVLQSVYDRIGTKLKLLSAQVGSRGITFGSHSAQDALILGQLCTLNEAYALLGVLVFAEGVHPLPAYLELCRLVGQLAIYGVGRTTPELPRYDHDDLGTCFFRVKNYIDALLDQIIEPDYKERAFVGAGLRMQVTLEHDWLAPSNEMYVAVRSPLSSEECVRQIKGGLEMKIASSERVEALFKAGRMGLAFDHCPTPPRVLPGGSDMTYFQINRAMQQAEWQHVQKELNLAVRLNERLTQGNITGEKTLRIRTGGTMQFTLFVTRSEP